MMTEVRVSKRSDLDRGEAGDGRSDTPMDAAMERATVARPIATDTPGTTIFQPMERNEIGKRRRSRQAVRTAWACSDWSSRIKKAVRQHPQELMQLHRTLGHLMNVLDAQAAREEAQWRGMLMWVQEKEQK